MSPRTKPHTETTKRKIGRALRKRVFSEETRAKMSASAKIRAKRQYEEGKWSPPFKGKKLPKWVRQKQSRALRGRKLSEDNKRKIGEANRRNGNDKFLRKLQKGQAPYWAFKWGPENHFWRGGVTPEHWTARVSAQYQEWRKAVLARDGNRCRDCGKVNAMNHAHHLQPFRRYPLWRFVVENGITVCASCHRRREASIGHCENGVNSGDVPTGIIPSQA